MLSSMTKNFTRIPNELFQAQTLDLRAIGLYAYLAYRSYSGHSQIAFPSQKTMMTDLKIGSDTTFRKILFILIDNGFIKYKKGSTFTGNSHYSLLIPKITEFNSS